MSRVLSQVEAEDGYAEFMKTCNWTFKPSLHFWWYMEEVQKADGTFLDPHDLNYVSYEAWMTTKGLTPPVSA